MRVLFAGSPPFATPILCALLASRQKVAGVLTQPGRPRGRGQVTGESEIEALARQRGLLLSTPEDVNSQASIAWCAAVAPDVIAVASFGQIFKEKLLTLAPKGAVNVHASLLPRHRGASPVSAAIRQGDAVTGVSIQRMVKKLDAGPVAAYLRTDVGPAESAGELTARLAILGGGLLVTVLDSMEARTARFTDQDEALATVAPKLTKDSGTIDWARPAAEIERLIRAMTPWPGAFTFLHRERQGSGAGSTSFERRGEPPLRLKLLRAEVKEWVAKPETPGTIVDLPAEHSSSLPRSLGVTTSEGLLVILEVQPEGGKAMGGADFLRGQRLTRGANLQS